MINCNDVFAVEKVLWTTRVVILVPYLMISTGDIYTTKRKKRVGYYKQIMCKYILIHLDFKYSLKRHFIEQFAGKRKIP